MSADSSGNGHRLNTIRPTMPQRHLRGFRDSQNQNVRAARLIGTKFGTFLRIRLGLDIAKYNLPLNTTWGISGGFRGVINLSLEKLPNGWTDWHQIRYTSVDWSGN